ncbi:lipopolysaccharide biosynthesis protein [Patescibacteria group bacterium]|nr:lipopolysaccharide biosynthesis protein [Patescibacteria group bacterium]
MAEASLKQKAFKGGFWVFTTRIVSRAFSFLRLIILARLLAPDDFGLMGIALLSMATLETFSETGFQQALIQKKEKIEDYLNSAWAALVLRGVFLFTFLYLIAPYAATFFGTPLAIPIIRVISLSLLVQAFTNIGIVYFRKDLEFNRQFFYELSGVLADFLVAVTAALILRNTWALVFGFLAGSLARLITSYFLHPWRPRFVLDIKKTAELFNFGRWVFGSSILIFLVTHGDDIFVGRFFGVTALGFYQMAYKISNLPATEISHVISQVTFPTYSKLQDNLAQLRKAFLRVFQGVFFLSILVSGLIFIFAYPFTKIFLGEKWLPLVSILRILALAGLLESIASTTGSVFYALGKPEIETRWQVIRLLVLVIFIYWLAMRWGVVGVATAVLISNLVITIAFIFEAVRITKS